MFIIAEMGTELPKTQESSEASDSNTEESEVGININKFLNVVHIINSNMRKTEIVQWNFLKVHIMSCSG